MASTGVESNRKSPNVPLYSPEFSQAVNPNKRGAEYDGEARDQNPRKEEGYDGVPSRRDSEGLQESIGDRAQGQPSGRTGRTNRGDATTGVTGEHTTCGKASGERRSWRALASRFFRRTDLPVIAPFHHTPLTLAGLFVELDSIGTIHAREDARTISPVVAAPTSESPVLPPAASQPDSPAPFSERWRPQPQRTLAEIMARIVVNAAGCGNYIAVWDIAEGSPLVLFSGPCGTTLALKMSELSTQNIHRKYREAALRFGVEDND